MYLLYFLHACDLNRMFFFFELQWKSVCKKKQRERLLNAFVLWQCSAQLQRRYRICVYVYIYQQYIGTIKCSFRQVRTRSVHKSNCARIVPYVLLFLVYTWEILLLELTVE